MRTFSFNKAKSMPIFHALWAGQTWFPKRHFRRTLSVLAGDTASVNNTIKDTDMEKDRGVLVLDEDGTTQYAGGIARDTVLAETLARQWHLRSKHPIPTIQVMHHLDRALIVLRHATPGAGCFLLQFYDSGDPLVEFVASVDFAGDILRHFITNPYEAMTVVDAQAAVRYISPVHERFFKLTHGEAIGRKVREVIENTRLDAVLRTGRAEIGQAQEMHGTTRVVSRTPIFNLGGDVVGAIGQVMFKSPDAVQAMSAELGRLRREIGFYRRELSGLQRQSRTLDAIVGESDAIRTLKAQILKVAPLNVSVLLLGESGVGKDLVAHALHALSARASEPIVVINAAALPTALVESELFGYEGGAFTGAERKGRRGKFEQADRGTLFLDEIGDMPLEIQVKLLRTLQDGSFQRLGSDQDKKSNFRLISASNRDFKHMLANGDFRLDLFYRISAVTLRVPSLRERLDDIELLVQSMLEDFALRHGMAPKRVETDVIPYLQSQPWPGNVRQLQHAVDRAAIFAEGDVIRVIDFDVTSDAEVDRTGDALGDAVSVQMPGSAQRVGRPSRLGSAADERRERASADAGTDLRSARSNIELDLITEAMGRFNGNKKRVAEHLGISRSYLYKRLADLIQ